MKRFALFALLLSALALSGCGFTGFHVVTGSGKIVAETRDVSGFDAVDFSGSGDLIITQGDTEGVRIEADENVMPYIRSEVRGHTLHVYIDDVNFFSIEASREMKVYVSMKDVTSLDLSGSGTISSDKITGKNIDVVISGSGDIRVKDLQADSLNIDVSGSGSCDLAGKVDSLDYNLSGSGRCDASDLDGKDVKVDISGSGSIQVNAAETLNVHISGSGDVTYTGNPKITQNISGSGELNAR